MTVTLTHRWDVIITLSCASFAARNFGVKTVTGQVAALSTGNARRDRDLAKPRLLDTGRHAELVFSGGPGQPADGYWQVLGKLSGHGASVDVELAVTVQRSGDEVHVHATTSFDRRDLGITAPRTLIGTRIAVTVDAVLRPA